MKKYIFDFFVIFISITASFALTEWQRLNIHRGETITAIKAVRKDLMIDTASFNRTLRKLSDAGPVLLEAMNGTIEATELEKLKQLLESLRAYHGIGIQQYGYQYLSHNIRNPSIYSRNLLQKIGVYHERSSQEGNFGGFNRDYYEICFENHKRLFELFPNYLHPDTTKANQAVLDSAQAFLDDAYWKSRISLTYRQIISYNTPVYQNQKALATKIIKEIEEEIYLD